MGATGSVGGAFLPDADYNLTGAVTLNGSGLTSATNTQTLTNKTLTSPVVNNAALSQSVEVVASGDKTVTIAMNGRSFIATAGSGTQTFTLPTAASSAGARVTFICGSAAGEILVTPNAADQISAKGLVDHSTSVKPAAGTGIKNTAATNVLGDHITLVSDGLLTWHEVAGAGIWASQ